MGHRMWGGLKIESVKLNYLKGLAVFRVCLTAQFLEQRELQQCYTNVITLLVQYG